MTIQKTTNNLQQYIQQNPSPNTLSEEQISPLYQQFIDCLTDHNHLYYIDNNPIISDKEYDDLFSYIKKIEEYFPHIISSNSPTQRLIGQIQDGFQKANHLMPMLSLENSYNAKDLEDRDIRIKKIIEKKNKEKNDREDEIQQEDIFYYIEPKIDGVSIELIYKSGELRKAITRGDGIIGEDVTENVKTIKNIPKKLKNIDGISGLISLRGEIIIGKSELNRINQDREVHGLPIFANTRNLASGSLKQLDPAITASRNLKCFVYELYISEENKKNDVYFQNADNKNFTLLGFEYLKLEFIRIGVKDINEVIDICKNRETQNNLYKQFPDIEFDGLVIKIDDFRMRDILGSTEHHPRRAIAYKFPAQQISTQIQSVDRQVGRSGVITPVANLTPVQLSGVTISRVSLHNSDFIKTKDIQLHDYVRVQRSGEVIPYIVGVIKERRKNTQEIIAPSQCPSCGHNTSHIDMHTYCTNHACPAQLQEKIEHFVSKQCMDIEGIGESIAQILITHNIIKTVDQLYDFTQLDKQAMLRSLPGFADKKVAEIVNQLEASKSKPLRRLIHGLGIPNIGKKTAMMIQEAIQKHRHPEPREGSRLSIDHLISYLTNQEFLEQIYGIGIKMVQSLQAFFHDQTNISIIQNIINAGVNIQPIDSNKNSNSPFTGQHFAITGTFPVSREQIITACEAQGMIFDASPSKQSSYMFIGDNPGSKKTKAEEYNIPLIQSREQIITNFPFLKQILIQNKPSNSPTAQSLF